MNLHSKLLLSFFFSLEHSGFRYLFQNALQGTSLVAQWLRIYLPMQGKRIRALVREDQARVPQLLSLRSRACEPQLLSPHATTTEAHVPRACALQQEKAPQQRVAHSRRN